MRFLRYFLILLSSQAWGQSAFETNQQLGRGVNMGNMFEAPSEDAWGNPYRSDYFQRIADLGFQHVRIPITWDIPSRAQQEPPYTLNDSFLQRIKQVVDEARAAGLMVIINMHHHDTLFDAPEASKARFLSQWQQISAFFQAYDQRLLFEILNEPHGNLTAEKWNVFFRDALAVVREANPTRTVLLGVAEYGGLGGLSKLTVPDDPHLILSIHYYEPFAFTHQGAEWVEGSTPWLGTEWNNTDREQAQITHQFSYALSFAEAHNLPIHIGEFGAYQKADLESRIRWTTFLARWFEQQGFSWAYWEFSAGFGFFDPATNGLNQPLVNALLHDPMPDPIVTLTRTVYQSNFTSGTDGWTLQLGGDAAATLASVDQYLHINITRTSTEGWHIQLVRAPIPLEKGKQYVVSYEVASESNAPASTYIGMARSPWSTYSGYSAFTPDTQPKTFEYVFEMAAQDDPSSRLVFDLGMASSLQLRSVRIAEIVPPIDPPLSSVHEQKAALYPNPTRDEVQFTGVPAHTPAFLIDAKGNVVRSLSTEEMKRRKFSISGMPPGTYFFRFGQNTLRLVIP